MSLLSIIDTNRTEKVFRKKMHHSGRECIPLSKADSGTMKDIYDTMWTRGIQQLAHRQYATDPYIKAPSDNRRGLSLILRPSAAVTERIAHFLQTCHQLEPGQYYYNPEEFHITFLSLISCHESFNPQKIPLGAYVATLDELLKKKPAFSINHQGITVSESCVMVQGFCPEHLNNLRNEVREAVAMHQLPETMDKRYLLRTAHSTVIRYATKIKNPEAWLELLEKYRNEPFGFSEITHLDLVLNDWYMKRDKLQVIKSFPLQKTG